MKLYRRREEHFQMLASLIAQPERLAAIHADTKLPVDVAKWLGRLKDLYGVPFNYLVPDEAMLPAESIRFFQVDLNWIYSLLEGAFSIGRSTASDVAHDTLFTRRMHAVAGVAARHIRATRLPERMVVREEEVLDEIVRGAGFEAEMVTDVVTEREILRPEIERMELDSAARAAGASAASMVAANTVGEGITGFLLRSAVVQGWPGLEVTAFDKDGVQLPNVLRMDHLSPSILLYMVEGVIDHVDIKEPAESLHFGVDPGSDICGERSLRYVTVPVGAPPNTNPGDQIDGASAGAVPCRPGRVLKIAQLAANIQAALQTVHANEDSSGNPGPFTSAEFALEMVEGVEAVRFRGGDGV